MEQNSPDLLHEYYDRVDLEPVSPGLRFANWLVDRISIWTIILGVIFLFVVILVKPDGRDLMDDDSFIGISYLLAFLIPVGYYTILEGAFKGRTVGKLVTGTVVVKEDGSPITLKDAFLRSLSRMVPFEPFSAISGRPWHDQWTKTMVIKKLK